LLFGLIGLAMALGNPRIAGPNAGANPHLRPIPQFQRHFLPVVPTPINPTIITPTQITPTQVNPTEINPTEVNPTEVTPTDVNPTPIAPIDATASMTTLPSMVANLVLYQAIPTGAPQQADPRIQMKTGKPTDLNQLMTCMCGGRLGYVAGGWFCLNPACPLRQTP
jgi:hypothetical protein